MEGTSKFQIHGVSPQGIIKIFFLLLTILTNAHGEKTMAHTTYSVVVKTVEVFKFTISSKMEKPSLRLCLHSVITATPSRSQMGILG